MDSPSPTTTRTRAVLPIASRLSLETFLTLAAQDNVIDATTALAFKDLLNDRAFALRFKQSLITTQNNHKIKKNKNKTSK